MTIINEYKKNGFVLIKNVLDSNSVNNLRLYINNKIKSCKNKNLITISECFADEKIYSLLSNQKIKNTTVEIIGKDYFINELEVQYNSFPKKKNEGYHYDAQSERANNYLKFSDYKFAKWGIYLQNNTKKYGGGLSVLPGSHKIFPFFKFRNEKYIKFILGKFAKKINTEPGDAVLFDSRLLHTGTTHEFEGNDCFEKFIKGNEKIVIYWNVTTKKYSDTYLENNMIRCFKQEISKKIDTPYFSDSLKLYFPDDYEEKFVEFAKNNNIGISSVDKIKSDLFKNINSNFNFW